MRVVCSVLCDSCTASQRRCRLHAHGWASPPPPLPYWGLRTAKTASPRNHPKAWASSCGDKASGSGQSREAWTSKTALSRPHALPLNAQDVHYGRARCEGQASHRLSSNAKAEQRRVGGAPDGDIQPAEFQDAVLGLRLRLCVFTATDNMQHTRQPHVTLV